ncbi:type II toxin-antitoxin system RelE/ParE family toxin [Candidatus Peregrinibacteria bacterium]|nr:type II toxin-antitoxin system RelE/ParE family toxin [Candidatus Peregrinibacteria bacterium]
MHTIIYTKNARKDLRSLESHVAKRILRKLNFYILQNDPLKCAKALKNHSLGHYRYRVGDYRVLFDISRDGTITILIILKIKHRKDIYLA